MILSYVIVNNTESNFPLDPGEVVKFIIDADDEYDAYLKIEMAKSSAVLCNHKVMNVYLNGSRFDAREYWTEGANSDDFDYDDTISINRLYEDEID